MNMEQWQDAASQQVKLIANRLNELLSRGLDLLRTELGVDLGLKPEFIPPWVILLAACTGLVLMLALWASVCRSVFKKRAAADVVDHGTEVKREVIIPVKSDEPKKKKKKKAQPNGRAVAESQEEAIVSEEIVPHHQPPPPEPKAEQVAEVKKSKKKTKQAVKETKTVTAVKEPEEGTWETKVSNKEKREQRKKDKGSSDGSASPGGGSTPVNVPPEKPKAPAPPQPTSQKKKKGESAKMKEQKVDAVVCQVNSNKAEVAASVADVAVKAPAPAAVAQKAAQRKPSREPATLWKAEIDESWTVIERGIPASDLNLVSFTNLGVGAAERDLPWLSQPRVDEEWSGLNGGSVDPSSDWNAPSEAWGNYEEPPLPQEEARPVAAKAKQPVGGADDDEDEKDKGEAGADADAAAKAKKKKKKKKKAAEEGGTTAQGDVPEKREEPAAPRAKKQQQQQQPAAQENSVQPVKQQARPVKDNISQKPPVTQVPPKPTDAEPVAKQSNVHAPTQKTPEESQAAKPAKKKKARRET